LATGEVRACVLLSFVKLGMIIDRSIIHHSTPSIVYPDLDDQPPSKRAKTASVQHFDHPYLIRGAETLFPGDFVRLCSIDLGDSQNDLSLVMKVDRFIQTSEEPGLFVTGLVYELRWPSEGYQPPDPDSQPTSPFPGTAFFNLAPPPDLALFPSSLEFKLSANHIAGRYYSFEGKRMNVERATKLVKKAKEARYEDEDGIGGWRCVMAGWGRGDAVMTVCNVIICLG
jgi:hypothetical protein